MIARALSVGFAFVAATFLASCGVSKSNRTRVEKAVTTFVSEWQAGDLTSIYKNSDPHVPFLKLEDWVYQKRLTDRNWGSLQTAQIVEIESIAPYVGMYQAVADFHYQKGTTRGSLTFALKGNTPYLVGTILQNPTQSAPFE